MTERVEQAETLFKSQFIEINEFLHTIHKEFDGFVTAHKTEHIGLNVRMLKISEECSKMLDHYKRSKTQLEQQAMAIACLVEFDSMAQALSQHEMSMIDNLALSPRLDQTK